jgi:hypothetical protein
MFISGPRNTQGIGCEQGTTACMLMVGQGGDHMTSSMIYHDSNATCFPNTILGAGQICSPYHTATSTCSTAGLRVYGASGTHQWDMYLNGANIRFSDNTTGGAFVVDNNVCVGGGLVAQAASTFCNTVALMGSSAQLYIGNSSAASDYSILGWCSTCQYLNIHQQSTGNAPQLVIACNGNVGIGTCYPNSILTVSAIDSNQASNLSTAYTNAKFRVNTYLTSGQGVSIGNIIGYQQYIQAQYSDSVTTNPLILNPFGGPVGIGMGTTCPSYILDVSGSAARVKNTGGSADFILDRASSSAGATYQYVTNGSLKWYTGLRGLVNDNFYLFNNSIGSNALVFDGSSVATFSCTVIACANLLVGTTTAYHSLTVLKNQNGDTATGIYNQTDGTASSTTLRLDNGSYNGQLNLYANSYTTSGTAVANTLRLYTDGPGGISVSATNQHIRFYTSPNECLRMAILYGGAVGIGNSNPKHNLDICSVTTNSGGFSFCNLLAPQGAWCTFACVASDANVVTQVTFTNTLDYNRSGVFVARWAYNTACAALHIVSCLWSNSQNVNFDFRNNSGALQICTSGGGGDYRVQAFTQGAKAT